MLVEFEGKRPKVHKTAFIHPRAMVIGNVSIGEHSSVWPGAVIRGDFAKVEIGRYTCIQDNAVVHADVNETVKIGDHVVVGHQALVHGATISDNSLVGAGAIVFSGVKVGEGALVGMGAVVLKGVEVPPRTVVVGIPARPLRKLKKEETKYIRVQVERYDKLAERYKKATRR